LLVGLWILLLFIAANPAWLLLPGTGVLTNFALFIAVYLPASLLAGVLVACIVQKMGDRRWALVLIMFVLIGLGVWGASQRLKDLDPEYHAMVTHPDARAAAWIRENTSPEARFLVNSFRAYGGSVVAGADGGWWLPLLAERPNTTPPFTYSTELDRSSSYRQQVEELADAVQSRDLDDPVVLNLLRQQDVSHVYVGQRQGRVGNSEPTVLKPEKLLDSPHYQLLYHQDLVWIFGVEPQE
jgi:hypothetical protein